MKSSKSYRLTRRSGELANAVPQVVAMRVGRMWSAGPLPSARDQQEFYRMGAEKVEAFYESWLGMASQGAAAQQQWAQWCLQTWWKLALGGWMNPPTLGQLSGSAGRQRSKASRATTCANSSRMADVATQRSRPAATARPIAEPSASPKTSQSSTTLVSRTTGRPSAGVGGGPYCGVIRISIQ